MQITLKLENIEAVKRKLEDIEGNITDTASLMGEIANYLKNQAVDSFENERDWNNKPWSPLSSATYLFKQKKGKPDKKLFYDGGMQGALISESDNDSAIVGITTVNDDDYFYPIVHQFGTNNAGRNKKLTIPARSFLPINADGSLYEGVENIITEITVEFIESGLK